MSDFVAYVDDRDNNVVINLSLIRRAAFGPDGLDIWFAADDHQHFNGPGARVIFDRICEGARAADGTPLRTGRTSG